MFRIYWIIKHVRFSDKMVRDRAKSTVFITSSDFMHQTMIKQNFIRILWAQAKEGIAVVSGKLGFGTKQIRERVGKRFGRNYLHREFMAQIPKLFRSFQGTIAGAVETKQLERNWISSGRSNFGGFESWNGTFVVQSRQGNVKQQELLENLFRNCSKLLRFWITESSPQESILCGIPTTN